MSIKYFKEVKNKPHLDIRYGKQHLSKKTIHDKLKCLLKETVVIFNKYHIPCIIMHGSLIGWFFNKKMLPWDDDIDIVILDEYRELLKCLDGFQNNDILIEVNPVIDTIYRDPSNIIEARIICKHTGVFIDITNLSKGNIYHIGSSSKNTIVKQFKLNTSYNTNNSFYFKCVKHKYNDHFDIRYQLVNHNTINIIVTRKNVNSGWGLDLNLYGYDNDMLPLYNKNTINCFRPHYYPITDIYPLTQTIFEDITVYVPNNVENTLIREYGSNVIKPYYKNYIFTNGQWIKK